MPLWKQVLIVSWLFSAVYVFSLPLLSVYANARVGDTSPFSFETPGLCSLPPTAVTCSNGVNLTEALNAWGRKNACGCGQGVFGEGVCPLVDQGYSISGFVATGPGTGMMALFTLVPIVSMWAYMDFVYHNAVLQPWLAIGCAASLVSFQVFYMLFLSASFCVFPSLHEVVVSIFILSLIIHFLLLAGAAAQASAEPWLKNLIFAAVVLAVTSLVAGLVSQNLYVTKRINWPYGFWLGECVGLSMAMGLSPLLFLLDNAVTLTKSSVEPAAEEMQLLKPSEGASVAP